LRRLRRAGRLVECHAGDGVTSGGARVGLPAPHDHVDVKRIEFEPTALPDTFSLLCWFETLNLSIAKTINNMVVHHAESLHVCIDDRRTDEGESSLFEVLAERIGFR
jgi:hypothetical protein